MPELPQVTGLYDPELAKVRVACLAGRQSGVVARRQLALLGASDTQIRRWTASGYLIRRLPGVYAVGHAAPSAAAELAAALLYAGPGAMLTGATGLWWLELSHRRAQDIQIISPRRRGSRPGIEIRTREGLTRGWHRNLPVAPCAQVLLDYAAAAPDPDVRRALAQAEYHGYLDVDLLRAELGRGRPGSTRLREALAGHDPRLARTRSELELAFLGLCAAHDIPAPEVNVTAEGHLVDMLWRQQRVIVELDGAANHGHWAQIQRDRARDLALRAVGYVVLRYVWAQVIQQAAAVADDVRAALARPRLD